MLHTLNGESRHSGLQQNTEVMKMAIHGKVKAGVAAVVLLVGLSACANMSTRDRNTAIGAGVGGVAGSVLTDGSAVGTIGGAVVGGVIGNQTGK
ncbi:glycine zipper 2TM domain-containing protein [Oceanimonas sp. CAM02]|uniref:glycine zipper 2TM domain-containing protein n=1 Tax=Oceanimonas sp. CAM02 TaxID=3080336 RepID=UPI0029367EBF|nr:glycine zipper 2TM domain-containing protein [Oceanimonas sp. CAM02]MDV2856771.1 glycine zipper 2TM domain-containing protein [Oceanimonas sp. CAM02]